MSGLGGLGGLALNGKPFDATNEYNAAAPAGAPPRGEPAPKYSPYLTRRGNLMYGTIEQRGATSGKAAIGITSSSKIIVGVQPHGTNGESLDRFRDRMIAAGAQSGVLLDCSDSACLIYKGQILARPADHKNFSSAIGVGFRA